MRKTIVTLLTCLVMTASSIIPYTAAVSATEENNENESVDVNVNVLFWYENANDNNYSLAGGLKQTVAWPAQAESVKVKPSDYKDLDFAGVDKKHFIFDDRKDDEVAVDANGTTTVNVYFARKEYRLIFFDCTMHTKDYHISDSNTIETCYLGREASIAYINDNNIIDSNGPKEYEDGDKKWNMRVFTRKWQQNISGVWDKQNEPLYEDSKRYRWLPYQVNGENGEEIFKGDASISRIYTMPDADIVLRHKPSNAAEVTLSYYVESLDGDYYEEYDSHITKFSSDLRKLDPTYAANELLINIEGFTPEKSWSEHVEQTDVKKDSAEIYYKRNEYELNFISGEKTLRTVDVPFGDTIKACENYTPTPPSGYEFEGWYLTPDCITGTEVDWDAKMPVGGISVYAKWRQTEVSTGSGTISYELEDGTVVADPTPISGNVGETKTFEAKGSGELYDTYKDNYIPTDTICSITFASGDNNNYTFIYEQKPTPITYTYTVKYLENGGSTSLFADKEVTTTEETVTETYVPIAGYVPDAETKTMTLDANGTNEIIFYYTPTQEHATLQIEYYLQNINGEGYTTFRKTLDSDAIIGTTYTAEELTATDYPNIAGFTLNEKASIRSGTLGSNGLELKMYYDRKLIPYEFMFVDEDGDQIANSVTGTAGFEATVTHTAPAIEGYSLVDADDNNKSIEIGLDEGENVAMFVYTKNEQKADVRITYYVQNLNDGEYELVKTINDQGNVGTTYAAAQLTEEDYSKIAGFTLNEDKSKQSGELTSTGLVLEMYYDIGSFPYEFKFVDEDGNKLAESVTGTAKFESEVKQKAKDIQGYELIDKNEKEKTLKISAEGNTATFAYKEVKPTPGEDEPGSSEEPGGGGSNTGDSANPMGPAAAMAAAGSLLTAVMRWRRKKQVQ